MPRGQDGFTARGAHDSRACIGEIE